MSKAFVAAIHRFAKTEGIDLIHFASGQRKDDETQRQLKRFEALDNGVRRRDDPQRLQQILDGLDEVRIKRCASMG